MTMIALVHNHFDADHLDAVCADMATMGAPTIKAVWLEAMGCWQALEGCHRVRAAARLGMTVIIDPIDYDETLLTDVVDGWSGEPDCTVADLCDDAWQATMIKIND